MALATGQNYGLRTIWPPLTAKDEKALQGLHHDYAESKSGVMRKGFNEFVIYGQDLELYNI